MTRCIWQRRMTGPSTCSTTADVSTADRPHLARGASNPRPGTLDRWSCDFPTVFILIVAHWAWARHEVGAQGWAQNLTANPCIFVAKPSISLIFVCQELDDEGGGRLLGYERLFEWIRYFTWQRRSFASVRMGATNSLFHILNMGVSHIADTVLTGR